MKAVLLAGGIEMSASPYNQVFPKPMLPVGEKPILELALKQLKKHGFKEFHIVVGNISGQLIQAYLHNGEELDIQIYYHWEETPLGTAGALRKVDSLDSTFLMMNGDILTTLDFSKLLDFHKKNKPPLTIACNKKGIYLDFGFLELSGEEVLHYREKPTLDTWISMGVYVMEPEILKFLPNRAPFHIPDLVSLLIQEKQTVLSYEDESYWLDIGNREEYEKANRDFAMMKSHYFAD